MIQDINEIIKIIPNINLMINMKQEEEIEIEEIDIIEIINIKIQSIERKIEIVGSEIEDKIIMINMKQEIDIIEIVDIKVNY